MEKNTIGEMFLRTKEEHLRYLSKFEPQKQDCFCGFKTILLCGILAENIVKGGKYENNL